MAVIHLNAEAAKRTFSCRIIDFELHIAGEDEMVKVEYLDNQTHAEAEAWAVQAANRPGVVWVELRRIDAARWRYEADTEGES